MKTSSSCECTSLKNIVILALGGTIAGVGNGCNSIGYDAGVIPIDNLIESVPGISSIANLTGIQIINVDSNDITYKDWKELVDTINNLSKSPDVDGFVITSGTDTLEETAFFLNLTIKTNKPVVVTGAMRPSTAISADGSINLYQSVVLASCDLALNQGVMVCFNNSIFSARDIQKTNTFEVNAFSENLAGSLGFIRDNTVFFFNKTIRPHTVESIFDITNVYNLPKVEIAYFAVEVDPNILNFLASSCAGIIIASAGDGGMSKSWISTMNCILNRGTPVIVSTRACNGNVSVENNASIFNPQKARILLQLALTTTNEMDKINHYFTVY